MTDDYSIRQKELAIETLKSDPPDFIGSHHAVYALNTLAEKHTEVLDPSTIETLENLIRTDPFKAQRHGYFLYREAASVLSTIIARCPGQMLADSAQNTLIRLLSATRGNAHRGCAEALGSLPVSVCGPVLKTGKRKSAPTVSFSRFLKENKIKTDDVVKTAGRSLIMTVKDSDQLLVFKLARKDDNPSDMANEIMWLKKLAPRVSSFPYRFHIPRGLSYKRSSLFKIKDLPLIKTAKSIYHPKRYAISFLAHKDYFVYPNGSGKNRISSRETLMDIMGRNAWLAGRLTAMGIVHDALIPLFHNRIQRFRRQDQGRYQWYRAGRLDRWLDSCRYPNIGLSGLRDFEHLVSFKGSSRILYRHIGSHLLSFFLIAGSYFRNKNENLCGIDKNGNPVDARHLFDMPYLKSIMENIFLNYYKGFTGRPFTGPQPVDLDALTARMVEEMGVDRHMKEYLRKADQNSMTREQFASFLMDRGYPEKDLETLAQGTSDIAVMSGPHLGGFNRTICIPELIECVAGMSAICIAGKHQSQVNHAA